MVFDILVEFEFSLPRFKLFVRLFSSFEEKESSVLYDEPSVSVSLLLSDFPLVDVKAACRLIDIESVIRLSLEEPLLCELVLLFDFPLPF